MSLTIELHRIGPNKAQAQVDGEVLADFDPQALLAGAPRRGASRKEMVAYGRRLWAALGGEALGELVDELAVPPDLALRWPPSLAKPLVVPRCWLN